MGHCTRRRALLAWHGLEHWSSLLVEHGIGAGFWAIVRGGERFLACHGIGHWSLVLIEHGIDMILV